MATEAAPVEAGARPRTQPRPRPPRRTLIATVLRAAGSVAAAVTVYYVVPLDGRFSVSAGAELLAALVLFVVLGISQVKSVVHAAYPGIRAVEVLAVLIPVFILTFSAYYYVVGQHDPGGFSTTLTRTDALYFTVTTLATVGYGDITPTSEGARIAVTVQMIADLAVLGVLVRTAARAVAHGWDRQERETREASPAPGDAAYAPPDEHR